MNNEKIGSLLIIIGSIIFLIASFTPVSMAYAEPSVAGKLEIIQRSRVEWTLVQILYVAGSLVVALGLAVLAYGTRGQSFSRMLIFSAVLFLLAVIFMGLYAYISASSPRSFAEGASTDGLFLVYSLLAQLGLLFLGVALLGSSLRRWVGWLVIGFSALVILLSSIFRDMPPFVYYFLTLLVGIMVFRAGSIKFEDLSP